MYVFIIALISVSRLKVTALFFCFSRAVLSDLISTLAGVIMAHLTVAGLSVEQSLSVIIKVPFGRSDAVLIADDSWPLYTEVMSIVT